MRLAINGGPKSITVDWQPEWPYVGREEFIAVNRILKARTLSLYNRSGIIAEFEDSFAEYHRTSSYEPLVLSHNSGTSALHAAYFGLGLGPGDEAIVPTYTFLATVTPLLQCGVKPVFADVDASSLTIDPNSVLSRLSKHTKAIVVTHMWGHPADMRSLLYIAEKTGIPVVEDCSHAHGATIDGQKVGSFGSVACFSLEGHKAMTAGEGGVLMTSSRKVYERAVLLGHFGRRSKDEVALADLSGYTQTGFGHKYRMHPLGAAIALEQLRRLDSRNEIRRANLDLLAELLAPVRGVRPPSTPSNMTRGGWYGFKVRYVPDELPGVTISRYIDALRAEGVVIKRPGSPPLHNLPVFRLTRREARKLSLPWWNSLPYRQVMTYACPIAEEIYPTLLSLPTFSGDCAPIVREYAAAIDKVGTYYRELIQR